MGFHWGFWETKWGTSHICALRSRGRQNGDIYNGADDDGSGTVALLEIAEAFQRLKKQVTDLNVRSCFTCDGEEHGLLGSSYYSENPLFPMANTIADINIDMIGRRDEAHTNTNNYVYVIGADRLSSDLDNITTNANKSMFKWNWTTNTMTLLIKSLLRTFWPL
jgi:Zn-dependent M28 family amino/carboxypeptidase